MLFSIWLQAMDVESFPLRVCHQITRWAIEKLSQFQTWWVDVTITLLCMRQQGL